jgi:ankyrin repeat protein
MELTKRSWNVRAGRLARVVAFALACSAPALVAAANAVVEPVENPAPLVLATRKNDMAAARALLAANPRPDVNQRTADGTSALHWAVYHDRVDLIEQLLAAGADVKVKNDYGATPMSEAAVVGNAKVLRALLKAGADVESPNSDGQTALMIIARTSNVDAARVLIGRGAKVNAREQWRGQTPLMWAAAENQPAMVRLLVDHGAEVNARSSVNEWERQVTAGRACKRARPAASRHCSTPHAKVVPSARGFSSRRAPTGISRTPTG